MESTALRFLALGDSYTIGEAVRPEECWPAQFAALLRQQGVAIGDPLIIARTGWTTAELAAGIAAAQPQGPFELVSLLIGVNNQYRGLEIGEYRIELRGLLAQALGFAGGRRQGVALLSIPDWGVTPFAEGRNRTQIAAEIDAFNTVVLQEAQQAGVCYIDVTAISRRAAQDASLLAGDGLHPSGKMYAAWARLALEGWYDR